MTPSGGDNSQPEEEIQSEATAQEPTELNRETVKPKTAQEEPNLETIQPKIAQEESNLETIQPKITQEEPNLETIQPKIAQEEPNLETIQPKITQEEPNLETVQPKIAQEEPNLETIQPKITQEAPNLETIQPKIAQEEPNLETIQPKTAQEEPNMETIQPEIAQDPIQPQGTGQQKRQRRRRQPQFNPPLVTTNAYNSYSHFNYDLNDPATVPYHIATMNLGPGEHPNLLYRRRERQRAVPGSPLVIRIPPQCSSPQLFFTPSVRKVSAPLASPRSAPAVLAPVRHHKVSCPSPIMRVILEDRESEVSGSSNLVSPVQSRRRPAHGLPRQHPHSRVRKVSAPPELQPHLGGGTPTQHHRSHAHAHTTQGPGGTIPDHAERSSHPEYILSLPSHSHLSRGFYSGSDSGVPSEYSSCGGQVAEVNRHAPQNTFSPSASVNDLAHPHQTHEAQDVSFYQSDSDCESLEDLQSPQGHHTSGGGAGMNSQPHNTPHPHTEPSPLVLPVGSPPPFNRTPTEPIMNTPPAHAMAAHQARRHSMVVQLNLQGAAAPLPPGFAQAPNTSRSVSMVSLTGNPVMSTNMYPNLHNDTQSIYSDVGYSAPAPYHGIQHMDSQGSLAGGNHKVDSQQTLVNAHHPECGAPHQDPHYGATHPVEDCEKRSWFVHTLSENLSIMYAVFLVTLGIVIYLADTFNNHDSAMAEAFNVFLIVAQLSWLFYVHVDVRRYVSLISRALEEAKTKQVNKDEQVQLEPTGDGQYQLRINVPEAPRTIPQHYGFTSGRHGGGLYLKIGATVFCLGYLIHTGLNLGQKILYLTEEDRVFENCTCTTDVVMYVLQPVYAFYQLFFIFKYSNLIINRRKVFARFGIMHCIASSLCFWVFTIMQETLQAIFMKSGKSSDYSQHSGATQSYTKAALFNDLDNDDSNEKDLDDDDAYYAGNKAQASSGSSAWSINYGCGNDTHLSSMINATTPYLYPFSIEFNILMVGLWILLWENIGRFERHTHIPSVEVTYEEDNSKSLSSNLIIYVDCHASNRGLFAGLLMTVGTVISIILFFIFSASEDTRVLGGYVNGASEVILLTCMLVAGFFAYNSIRVLDMIKHGISSVDDILLYVCLPCIFFYAFFTLVPSITSGNYLSVCVSILQVSQVILQTALMGDGLRRCSNTQSLQHKKPGREVITYLVVANVAMWLLQTFEIKSPEGNALFYDFYGKELWTLLSHLTLPLALFYRFHSSVCLADMWKASYEEEEAH